MAGKGAGARSKGRQSASPKSARGAGNESTLSLERIVAAAIELLDEGGVDGLSMRRLAERLGAGAMSLYWHVANKEQVLGLALDAVLEYRGSLQAAGSRDWRDEVVHMLEDWRACMLRHPWSATLLPRQALGPNVLGRLGMLTTTLASAGVPNVDMSAAIWSLWNYVMGATVTRASFDLSDDDRAAAQQRLEHLIGRYPAVHSTGLLLEDDWDGVFRKGIHFLLDGLPH